MDFIRKLLANSRRNYKNTDKSIIEFSPEDCFDYLKNEIHNLAFNNNLGNYKLCKVTQILLFSEEKSINYFTNIDFSEKHTEIPFTYIL